MGYNQPGLANCASLTGQCASVAEPPGGRNCPHYQLRVYPMTQAHVVDRPQVVGGKVENE